VEVDVISGSVTDSKMGEDYIRSQFNVPAANARREGAALFELVMEKVDLFSRRFPRMNADSDPRSSAEICG